MPSPYDTYDYPHYWDNRLYEHGSEVLAIKSLLKKLKRVDKILEIGAGYGRLIRTYKAKGKNVILCDPSRNLLNIAKGKNKEKCVTYLLSDLESLNKHLKPSSIDLIIMIRVMHHIKSCKSALSEINMLLKTDGYFLLEFPNKSHIKNTLINLIKGNIRFLKDYLPVDIKKDKKIGSLPFKNYHPKMVMELLKNNGFNILDKRSSSNIRHKVLKRLLGDRLMILIEKFLQKPFSKFNLGPSIFILAQKVN